VVEVEAGPRVDAVDEEAIVDRRPLPAGQLAGELFGERTFRPLGLDHRHTQRPPDREDPAEPVLARGHMYADIGRERRLAGAAVAAQNQVRALGKEGVARLADERPRLRPVALDELAHR